MRILIAAIVIAVLGLVGAADYEDAVAAADQYTEMVCGDYWPDYENRKPECKQ